VIEWLKKKGKTYTAKVNIRAFRFGKSIKRVKSKVDGALDVGLVPF
jgi:hypothetical protein